MQGSFLFKSQPVTEGFHSGGRKERRGFNGSDGRQIYKESSSMFRDEFKYSSFSNGQISSALNEKLK